MKKYFTFWAVFYILCLLFIFPTLTYFITGIPEYLDRTTVTSKFWFVSHIVSGILIFAIAPFQFSSTIRNRNLTRHRKMGKAFILLSMYCILTLFMSIIPKSLCESCKASQYLVTTLWLVFLVAAYLSIIQKRIALHQRLMISAFICAAYFVTVRIINLTSMGFFNYISKDESQAYFISDIAAWFVPLSIVWIYWITQNSKTAS